MISAANLRFQDYQFQVTVPTGQWRWTTRVDVSGSAVAYQVRDIISPYGILRDTIPIPGAVIVAMGESIDQVQQNFAPRILIGPPTSISITVDEGRGFSTPETVPLTNSGVFGSPLSATLTPSAAYMEVSPTCVGNLASNESGSFTVAVDSTSLLSASSPYSVSVSIIDTTATNSPQTLPVTITVRPKATVATTPTTLTFTTTKPLSGDYPAIASQTFAVQNTGPSGSVLEYQIQKLTNLSPWLAGFAPTYGTIASGGSQTITVNVAPAAGTLAGTYEETLRISGYSTNSFVNVLVQLVINPT